LTACKETPSFQFESTSDKPVEIITWDDKVIVTDNGGDLYQIIGDTVKQFDSSNINSITKCKSNFYILKSPNDTTLVITESNGVDLKIKNKSGNKSKYFTLRTNEKCEILLECGMIGYRIQNDSLIDLNNIYGFRGINGFNGSDKFGYFDNFIFLTKYPDYSSGGVFQSYLDSDSIKYHLPNDTKIRDFTIHNNELLLATGFYEVLENKHILERKILRLKGGKIEEVLIKGIPDEMDIARLYSNGSEIYILSERFGFFKLNENDLEELVSIDLKSSKVEPESFVVLDNLIYLSTFNNGVIRFTIKDKDFEVKQILRSE
jgi:hypothetical protein